MNTTTCLRLASCHCLLLVWGQAWLALSQEPASDRSPSVYTIPVSDHAQYEFQARLIEAIPGDVIQFEEGRYEFRRQIDIVASHLTIRGRGSNKTVFSFQNQSAGNYGMEATGDAFTMEGIGVEDTLGNAVKILGANGVTLRDVRTEWTKGEKPSNGAYGLYPVQCQNVLIDNCTAIAAADAGIYVGQCHDVVVRNSKAERNVAGIEIENTVRADVYNNIAINNTGGILVFDLPGLQVKQGRSIRVFNNKVVANNHVNFAAPGSIVGKVPPGTGIMLMATDHVEVFDNDIVNHQTSGVSVVSYLISGKQYDDATYDPFPEAAHVRDNRITNSGWQPAGEIGQLLSPVLGNRFPDILIDGVLDERKFVDGKLPAQLQHSFMQNGEATFANFNFPLLSADNITNGTYTVDREIANYRSPKEALPAVKLGEHPPRPTTIPPAVVAYRSAPRLLSDYGLFAGDMALQRPAAGVVPYDLNTPLFSDFTNKNRFIRIPEGTQIQYREHGVFEFPVGTVIAKTFGYDIDMRDPSAGQRHLETRIETRLEQGWFGFTYIWNAEQTDASLSLGGSEMEVSWVHSDGQPRTNHYQVPNANQCLNCHLEDDRFVPLGPTAANLNRENELLGHGVNQLSHFGETGVVSKLPSLQTIAKMPVFDDETSGTIAERARAWLDVNCAHCHNPSGTARTSGLDLRASQNVPSKFGVWKSPVAAGHGSGGREYDIVPGKPDDSILLFRLESTDPSIAMPNVGRNLAFPAAINLVRQWIAAMPQLPQSAQ